MNKFVLKILVFVIVSLLFSCTEETYNEGYVHNFTKENNFENDKTAQTIVQFQQNSYIDNLTKFLNNENPVYIKQAIYSLLSLKDTAFVILLPALLKNKDADVRKASAYSIGYFAYSKYEQKLIDAYQIESDAEVKQIILEALGKCGTEKSMAYIASLNIQSSQYNLMIGQGRAFYFLAKRGFVSQQMTDLVFDIISNPDIMEEIKLEFSYFLTADKKISLNTNHFQILKAEIQTRQNTYLLCNLIIGLKHYRSQETLSLLKNILNADADYRIKLSALKTLEIFEYNVSKDVVFKVLQSKIPALEIAAAGFVLKKGNSTDVHKYLSLSDGIKSIQARSILYKAALYYASSKKPITQKIISGYEVTNNIYEKALLLYSLSADPFMYKYVKDETFSTQYKIVSTMGIRALTEMRLHKDFATVSWYLAENTGDDIYLDFKLIFKEAMTSGDNAMIYYASKIMNIESLNFFDEFTNTYFLNQALSALVIPRDLAAYKELCKTINKFGSQNCTENYDVKQVELDWDYISSIPGNQRVLIETNKGNFEITVDVNSAPATVAKFMELVNQKYYNQTYFYDYLPGEAVFNGAKRGDGWLYTNDVLVSELSNNKIVEGAVCFNPLADHYQSFSWFISTTQMPSVNSSATIFGYVTSGMEIVHKLEIGDVIYSIKTL